MRKHNIGLHFVGKMTKIKKLQKNLIFLLILTIVYAIISLAFQKCAGMMELADVLDSKSSGSDTVRVRPPLPAPEKSTCIRKCFFQLNPPLRVE